jgi:hypothetical protein
MPACNHLIGEDAEVFVLPEEHAAKLRCSLKKPLIFKFGSSVFVRGDHIDASAPQSLCNCSVNVMVHVEGHAQGRRPMALSLRRIDDSPRLSLIFSTSRSCSSISRSISVW